ncbi:MAG: DUF2069 domain-containing protein [Halioglobus sp.]
MSFFAWRSRSDKAHLLTWTSLGLLIVSLLLDAWFTQLPAVVWFIKVVPLMLFVPGMLRQNLRSYIWLCFVCLLYFLMLVERLFAEPGNVLAIIGMLAVVVLFNAAMLFVRWRAREQRQV